MARSIFEVVLSLGFILGSGHFAITQIHDTVRDMALSKVQKGLSSTKSFNDALWGR